MIIYKLTNMDNGKIYIGQTRFNLEKRFKEHAKADSYIGYAIRQHGEDRFKREVLATCKTREEAYALEIHYIAEFDCMAPNGYNLTPGGAYPLKKKSLGTGWIALYQNPSLWLAQQDLTGEQYKVLFVLFNKLDFENYLRIGLKDIAELLKMQVANVSRAMKKLKELEIIIEGPPAGKFKTYRLNPYIAHKGTERKDTICDFDKALNDKERNDDELSTRR